jgi:hypothetical protein
MASTEEPLLIAYYTQAAERLRQVDGMAYQLMQFYVTLYAAVFAVQNAGLLNHQQIWTALSGVSLLFLLIMLRLQRNYWAYTEVLKGIELASPSLVPYAPFTSVLKKLQEKSIRDMLSVARMSYLYCALFVLGLGFAAYCGITGFGVPASLSGDN